MASRIRPRLKVVGDKIVVVNRRKLKPPYFKSHKEALDAMMELPEERALLIGIGLAGRSNATDKELLEVAKRMIKEEKEGKEPRLVGKVLAEIRAEKSKK